MINFKNSIKIQGYIFDHSLQARVSQKGNEYIAGEIQVATDEEATNVVPVHFTYVTPVYSTSGKENPNYATLQKIIAGVPMYKTDGTDATIVDITGQAEVNDFYTRDGELASPKRVGGSFVNIRPANFKISDNPATFDLGVVLYGCSEKESATGDEYVQLDGYAFNFRNDILPISLSVDGEAGQKYFLAQDISKSNPLVTHVMGDIKSTTVVTEQEGEEGAFGGAAIVQPTTRTFRSWNVTWASAEPLLWDDESSITKDEFKECQKKRETYLADVKKRHDDYIASKNGQSGFPTEKKESKAAADDDYVF